MSAGKMHTEGWIHCFELGGLCSKCDRVVHEHRMCACDMGSKSFPKAAVCHHFKEEDEERRV